MIYLIIVLFLVIAFTQVDIFGYYEIEYDHIQLANKSYNFSYNKLRLDLESRPGENVKIGANINFRLFNGKTEFNIFDFLPMDSGEINGETISSLSEPLLDEMYLDNIYLRTSFQLFDFTIGKQPISLGTGYAWNPLDILIKRISSTPPTSRLELIPCEWKFQFWMGVFWILSLNRIQPGK